MGSSLRLPERNEVVIQNSSLIFSSNDEEVQSTSTWVGKITEALKCLGGKAHLKQIDAEILKNWQGSLPKMWQKLIRRTIYQHSSDTPMFQGRDIFKKMDLGVWALRDEDTPTPIARVLIKQKDSINPQLLLSQSLEDIENILRTIKEYREYYDPQSDLWENYIHEIFSILGFSVTKINPRLATLNVIGSNHKPKALVAFIQPDENFEEIVPGLSWESYMLFAANFYQIEWGILTDGLRLKINRYQDYESKQFQYWPNLDEIITSGISATFATIYKIFSEIKQYVSMNEVPTETTEKYRLSDNLLNSNQKIVLVHEFLNQLLQKANTKTQLHVNARLAMHPRVCVNAGMRSMTYCYHVFWEISRVNLYINDGSKEWNKEQFQVLYQHKDEIEARFGGPLEWQLLPNRKASRIKYEISNYGVKDRDRWSELQDQLIDAMIRLEKAFRPIIQSYR